MTHWHPDTCGCTLEISDDESNRGEVIRHVNQCKVHSDLGYNYADVAAENFSKNHAMNTAAELHPEKAFVWTFDKDRAVKVESVEPLTDQEKVELQTAIEARVSADDRVSKLDGWEDASTVAKVA